MDHAADYQKLLKVLLHEISAVWLYQLKEFMNHLGNYLIMAGTESYFQNFLQRPDIQMPHTMIFFFRRIHPRYFLQEQCITAYGTQGLYIQSDGPGAAFQAG